VNWLVSGRLDLGDETDHPECVQPVLNALAIAVNDRVSDEERQRMWPLILRQPGTARPEMEPVLSVRLAAFLAEQVLDPVRPEDRRVCRDAITAAQVWCDNPCEETASAAHASATCAAAVYFSSAHAYASYASYASYAAATYASAAAATATYATYAYAATAAAYATAYASSAHAYASYATAGPIALLSAAQDECERLTGHTPSEPDLARIERLGQLVGVR
jgi:hypothetical protein